ncbi:MAG: hypothetical protein AAF555_03120 [Verrucomicrobiota bacterium]
MIALHSHLPVVRFSDGQVLHFDSQWLIRRIEAAAHSAGHPDWWLAQDISKGVALYLRNHYSSTCIDLAELHERVEKSLHALGFQEIAQRLRLSAPRLEVDLLALAQKQASSGFEMLFFEALTEELQALHECGVEGVSFRNLRGAVFYLTGRKYWCKRCRQLEGEIRAHLLHRTPLPACRLPDRSLVIA